MFKNNCYGDFNIDLLKIETPNSNQEYYNLLCSYRFLPQIIQPTRVVVNHSPSLTDSIFTDNIHDEITSGNIFLTVVKCAICSYSCSCSRNLLGSYYPIVIIIYIFEKLSVDVCRLKTMFYPTLPHKSCTDKICGMVPN